MSGNNDHNPNKRTVLFYSISIQSSKYILYNVNKCIHLLFFIYINLNFSILETLLRSWSALVVESLESQESLESLESVGKLSNKNTQTDIQVHCVTGVIRCTV